MKLLAVDTATEACSAALLIDGEIRQQYKLAPREHSHLILPMVDQLLAEAGLGPAQLDALAFGRGPGAFMGIRIAAGVVQGIGFAHDLPVVPVSTLLALAHNAYRETGVEHILAAIDARMQEVYWSAWQHNAGEWRCLCDERVCRPDAVSLPQTGEHWLGAGSGWHSYRESLQQHCGKLLTGTLPQCFPSAEAIAELAAVDYASGNTVDAAAAVPVYLRDKVAAKPGDAVSR